MNGKSSKVLVKQGNNENQSEIAVDSVNNVRCYVAEGLLDLDSPIRNSVWYFLHLVYWKHLELKVDWDSGINLQYKLLEENIPNWRRVWPYCENRLVERVGGYAKGLKSYPYRTCSPYREQTHRLVTFEDKLLARRLRKAKKQFSNRPVVQKLRAQLDRISVNMDEFEAQYSNHPDRHYYFAHLQTIFDRMIRFTEDDFSGRIHTNITNLYKPLRKLLRVDGSDQPLAEIDIKNSQPLFLGVAAVKKGVVDRKYLDLCQQGLIYDHMADLLGLTRDGVKTEFMKLLFSENGSRSTAKSLFTREFPEMASLIQKFKHKDHRRLARHMQEAERKFIIDTVCKRLFKERSDLFVTTIHDSIMTKPEDIDYIKQVMLNEFAKIGIVPNLD